LLKNISLETLNCSVRRLV